MIIWPLSQPIGTAAMPCANTAHRRRSRTDLGALQNVCRKAIGLRLQDAHTARDFFEQFSTRSHRAARESGDF